MELRVDKADGIRPLFASGTAGGDLALCNVRGEKVNAAFCLFSFKIHVEGGLKLRGN